VRVPLARPHNLNYFSLRPRYEERKMLNYNYEKKLEEKFDHENYRRIVNEISAEISRFARPHKLSSTKKH
jgi:predicted secreted protein